MNDAALARRAAHGRGAPPRSDRPSCWPRRCRLRARRASCSAVLEQGAGLRAGQFAVRGRDRGLGVSRRPCARRLDGGARARARPPAARHLWRARGGDRAVRARLARAPGRARAGDRGGRAHVHAGLCAVRSGALPREFGCSSSPRSDGRDAAVLVHWPPGRRAAWWRSVAPTLRHTLGAARHAARGLRPDAGDQLSGTARLAGSRASSAQARRDRVQAEADTARRRAQPEAAKAESAATDDAPETLRRRIATALVLLSGPGRAHARIGWTRLTPCCSARRSFVRARVAASWSGSRSAQP